MAAIWFCRSEEELQCLGEKLKLTRCPHCQVVGTLILHGFLLGYDEGHQRRKTIRARRIFCSNRFARKGCGRTTSVWLSHIIRRLSLTAGSLWEFLKPVVDGASKIQAIRELACHLSDTALYRIWHRFELAQSHLRTLLTSRCPTLSSNASSPAAETIAHLEAAFHGSDCPITTFQLTMRTFFL